MEVQARSFSLRINNSKEQNLSEGTPPCLTFALNIYIVLSQHRHGRGQITFEETSVNIFFAFFPALF